jgi:HEAT repeat protein
VGDGNWALRLAVAKALGDRDNQETVPKLMPTGRLGFLS